MNFRVILMSNNQKMTHDFAKQLTFDTIKAQEKSDATKAIKATRTNAIMLKFVRSKR
jgi:hypothetical protein